MVTLLRNLSALSLAALTAAGGAQTYAMKQIVIQTSTGVVSGFDINDAGQVIVGDTTRRMWLWTAQAGVVAYGELPVTAANRVFSRLSEDGFSGASYRDDATNEQFYGVFSMAGWQLYPKPPGCTLIMIAAVTNGGTVCGMYRTTTRSADRGFVYSPSLGFRETVHPPGGYETSQANDVLDNGTVLIVGNGQATYRHVFVDWADTGLEAIADPPECANPFGREMGNNGTIAGDVFKLPAYNSYTFYRRKGEPAMYVRPYWDGYGSVTANSPTNDLDEYVALTGEPPNFVQRPAIWRYPMTALEPIIPRIKGDLTGWDLRLAKGINNKGQIVVSGYYNGSIYQSSVLLTPYSQTLVPKDWLVRAGREEAGNGTASSEKRFVAGPIAKAGLPAIRAEFSSVVPSKALYMWSNLMLKASAPCAVTLELWDCLRQEWDPVSARHVGLAPGKAAKTLDGVYVPKPEPDGFTMLEAVPKRPLMSFIAPDGTVKARVTFAPDKPTRAFSATLKDTQFEWVKAD